MAITLERLATKMTKRIGQVDIYEADALARKVRSVGKTILKTSPIDTGRFVGGWRTQTGVPDSASPSRTGQSTRSYNRMKRDRQTHERTPEAVINAEQEEKSALNDLNTVANGIRSGAKTIYLSNNVPYALSLENFGSRYGPRKQGAGFIVRAIKAGRALRSGKLRKRVFTS